MARQANKESGTSHAPFIFSKISFGNEGDLMFVERYSRAVNSSDLRDDAHHKATMPLHPHGRKRRNAASDIIASDNMQCCVYIQAEA
jgi:hypothetical protein